MNMEIFRLINNLANKNMILDTVMIFFSKYVPYIFIIVVAMVFISGIMSKNLDYRKMAVNTFFISVINLILSFIIGNIYYINRPFVNNKVNLLFSHVKDASFPSDHAMGTMSIALGFNKYNKLLSIVLTVLSLIVGFSRIYVGQHYPMDVIGAYIIVFLTSYLYNAKLKIRIENLYEIIEKKIVGVRVFYNKI